MSYPTNTTELLRLTREAMSSDDIRQGVERAGLSIEWLEVQVINNEKEIWESGASEIKKYNELEDEYLAVRARVQKNTPRIPALVSFMENTLRIGTGIILFLLFVSIIAGFFVGWRKMLNDTLTFWKLILDNYQWVITLGVFLLLQIPIYVLSKRRYKRENREYVAKADKEHRDLTTRRDEAGKAVENTILIQGVKPFLKELINTYLFVPFTTTLPKLNFSGLAEVFDSANEVDTSSKIKLNFMLISMPGGSIGIAGPRGAGKSTLLKSACRPSISDSKNPPKLTLLTSAPVEYQSRDFVLHLFSFICERALEITTGKQKIRVPIQNVQGGSGYLKELIYSLSQRLFYLSYFAGIALLMLGLALAVPLMKSKAQSNKTIVAQTQNNASQNIDGEKNAAEQDNETAPTTSTSSNALSRYIEATGIKPSLLITWGFLLTVISIFIRFFQRDYRRAFVTREHEDALSTSLTFAPSKEFNEETQKRLAQIHHQAIQWLRDIKFQQSYTTGWSGAFKLPIGLEGGLSTAQNLAQQQMSLPEIVHGLSNFLTSLSRDFKIIIGIDELDKIESDEAAQKFLNEIKAIFGLPGVFYLISVSENAMSNFERRGLPFRDVFDSSFDNIVHVDYLDYEAASRVIARRVIAMPQPFTHLCYCLSGGLARDLIRACRNLMEKSQSVQRDNGSAPSPSSNFSLSYLCRSLLTDDLRMKIQATVISANKLGDAEGITVFVDKLHKMEAELGTSTSWLNSYTDLMRCTKPSKASSKDGEPLTIQNFMALYDVLKNEPLLESGSPKDINSNGQVCKLIEQFATYVYYCATLLQFFNDQLTMGDLEAAAADHEFEKLTRGRQLISINQRASRALIDEFRLSNGMSVPKLN